MQDPTTQSSFLIENVSTGLCMPSRVPGFSGRGDSTFMNGSNGSQCSIQVSGQTTVSPSIANSLWQNSGSYYDLTMINKSLGRFNNVRQEYVTQLLSHNYPDVGPSFLQTCPYVLNQTYTMQNFLQNNPYSGYNPKNPYQIAIPQTINVQLPNLSTNTLANTIMPNTCNLYGFQKPICG